MRGTSSQSSLNSKSTLEGESSQTFNPQLFSNRDVLTILYYNARSLFSKIDELSALCTLHNPGIICVVETWLSLDIADSELSIPNYQVIRLDCNRHGGGVLMYVHNCLSYKVIVKGPALYCMEFLVLFPIIFVSYVLVFSIDHPVPLSVFWIILYSSRRP